jgi:hypothetical protein
VGAPNGSAVDVLESGLKQGGPLFGESRQVWVRIPVDMSSFLSV